MSNIVTDLSVNKKWYLRQSDDNEFSISFVDENADPFDVSSYVFNLTLARKSEKNDPDLTLTEGVGITNGGVTGVVTFSISDTQSSSLFNKYYYQIQATFPDDTKHVLFQGEAIFNDLEYNGQGVQDLTATVNLSGSNITATISISGVSNHSELTLDDGTNPHGTTKSDVGLGNVNNTADADKPISTATQSALDTKAEDNEVLKIANNLSDLNNTSTARGNLGVYSTTEANSAINNLFDVNSVALSTTTITLDFSSQRQKIFDTTTAHSANFNIAKDNESNMVLGSYTFETSTTNVVVTLEDGTGGTTEDDMPAAQEGWDDVNKQLTLAEAGVYELVYRKRASKYLVTLSQKF